MGDYYDQVVADYAREDEPHYTRQYVNEDGEPSFG